MGKTKKNISKVKTKLRKVSDFFGFSEV